MRFNSYERQRIWVNQKIDRDIKWLVTLKSLIKLFLALLIEILLQQLYSVVDQVRNDTSLFLFQIKKNCHGVSLLENIFFDSFNWETLKWVRQVRGLTKLIIILPIKDKITLNTY